MDLQEAKYQYLLLIGDNALILGHRLSELCGHGPSLETDIALTNIALDLFGQVRNYFQYAAQVQGRGRSEDDLAFLRYPHEYRNALLVEQPNTDFAHVIARQFFFDGYHYLVLERLTQSRDAQIAAIAEKSLKEVTYHLRFSSEWMKRLGDGTDESHHRMQTAVDRLWPYLGELWEETPEEVMMHRQGLGPDLKELAAQYWPRVQEVLREATLGMPADTPPRSGGKQGRHSEYMGYILAELQYMQRTYPAMNW